MEEFETGHSDRVTVIHINFDGSRILTASMDHRVKVWVRDVASGQKTLLDTFKAHDADIRDAKWFHASTGSHIATIGNDLLCRIWAEDPAQPAQSGRRFRKVSEIPSAARTPFVSLDLKTLNEGNTYLALMDRQGLLQLYEPESPDEFKDWRLIDKLNVVNPAPGRGQETSFRVRFDPNPKSLQWQDHLVGHDKPMLNLVVTAMNTVKIYRTEPPHAHTNTNYMTGTRSSREWEATELEMHPNLVRDVQWAPGNVRGTDLIASACKDGSVRIYEVRLSPNAHARGAALDDGARRKPLAPPTQPKSTLTTAIAGRKAASQDLSANASGLSDARNKEERAEGSRRGHIFPDVYNISLVTKLEAAHNDAWAVSWDPTGQVLMSGGADGVTKFWKQSIASGEWKLFADQAVDFGDDDER